MDIDSPEGREALDTIIDTMAASAVELLGGPDNPDMRRRFVAEAVAAAALAAETFKVKTDDGRVVPFAPRDMIYAIDQTAPEAADGGGEGRISRPLARVGGNCTRLWLLRQATLSLSAEAAAEALPNTLPPGWLTEGGDDG